MSLEFVLKNEGLETDSDAGTSTVFLIPLTPTLKNGEHRMGGGGPRL